MPMATESPTRPPRPAELWRQADAAERRRLIVDTALRLLDRHGPEAVTMRRVASRLGVGAMTLYTYIDGQHHLRREMVRRGFEMLNHACNENSTLGTPEGWRGGSRAYLRFAMDHPNLYKLMFDHPLSAGDEDLLQGGFQHLLDKVRLRLEQRGLTGRALDRATRASAGRFWIALHGLASLAIAGRLIVLEGDVDQILDDLLPRVAPT